MVMDPEVAALSFQRSLELLSAVFGCPGEEVVLLECVAALDTTAHHDEIVRIRNWSSEDLPQKGMSVSSCPAVGHLEYCLVRIYS